jgi:hypothetical protein
MIVRKRMRSTSAVLRETNISLVALNVDGCVAGTDHLIGIVRLGEIIRWGR